MPLDPQTVLQCTPYMRVRFLPATLVLERSGMSLEVDRRVLSVLTVFQKPTTFDAGLNALTKHHDGMDAWIRFSTDIVNLVEAGFLIDVSAQSPQTPTTDYPLPKPGDIQLHRVLLHDTIRTQQYLAALREVVTPDDIVVEIGTGSGVLAIGAALAGAKHVYAIEASEFAPIARQNIARNGLSERITVINNWSTRVTLPEKATVLVSEVIDSNIFGESILSITKDASERLLTPDARLIPNRLRAFSIPVYTEGEIVSRSRFVPERIEVWKQLYGIDFSPLLDLQNRLGDVSIAVSPHEGRWKALGDPVALGEVDLTNIQATAYQASGSGVIHTDGRVEGALLYFEADLAPNIVMTTHPFDSNRSTSWTTPVYLCESPIPVKPGDRLTYTITHVNRTLLPVWVTVQRASD